MNEKRPKLNVDGKKLKRSLRNLGVDAVSIIIFVAVSYMAVQGASTLYAAYYNTGKIPAPDIFSTASTQFATAVSLVYMLIQTRKHYLVEETQKSDEKNGDK